MENQLQRENRSEDSWLNLQVEMPSHPNPSLPLNHLSPSRPNSNSPRNLSYSSPLGNSKTCVLELDNNEHPFIRPSKSQLVLEKCAKQEKNTKEFIV